MARCAAHRARRPDGCMHRPVCRHCRAACRSPTPARAAAFGFWLARSPTGAQEMLLYDDTHMYTLKATKGDAVRTTARRALALASARPCRARRHRAQPTEGGGLEAPGAPPPAWEGAMGGGPCLGGGDGGAPLLGRGRSGWGGGGGGGDGARPCLGGGDRGGPLSGAVAPSAAPRRAACRARDTAPLTPLPCRCPAAALGPRTVARVLRWCTC